jgi:XapX domain-containing protein
VQPYLISFGAGLLVGLVYACLDVRSPAPPVIALLGLLGILLGEQARPAARRLLARPPAEAPHGAVPTPAKRARTTLSTERTDLQTSREAPR